MATENILKRWRTQMNQENAIASDLEKKAFHAFGLYKDKLLETAKTHRENAEAYRILLGHRS